MSDAHAVRSVGVSVGAATGAAVARTARTRSQVPAHFGVGDRVQVRVAFPPGHVRTPFYCRGKSGVIERLCGAFANPEELAYHRDGLPAQPLYRVRFTACELWGTEAPVADDMIEIEIYQHWLEAAPAT